MEGNKRQDGDTKDKNMGDKNDNRAWVECLAFANDIGVISETKAERKK